MIERTAHVILCDDLRVEITGKYMLVGMYTGSLAIPNDEVMAPQLVFLFLISTAVEDPFQSLVCEITLPGAEPFRFSAPTAYQANPEFIQQGARRIIHRIPVVMQQPVLRPGKTMGKVIHEKGEIEPIGLPFIVKAPILPIWIQQGNRVPPDEGSEKTG